METNRGVGDTLVDNIRAEMARRRITQVQIGRHLNLSQPAVSRRLTVPGLISAVELAQIADLLEVPVADLLGTKAAA